MRVLSKLPEAVGPQRRLAEGGEDDARDDEALAHILRECPELDFVRGTPVAPSPEAGDWDPGAKKARLIEIISSAVPFFQADGKASSSVSGGSPSTLENEKALSQSSLREDGEGRAASTSASAGAQLSTMRTEPHRRYKDEDYPFPRLPDVLPGAIKWDLRTSFPNSRRLHWGSAQGLLLVFRELFAKRVLGPQDIEELCFWANTCLPKNGGQDFSDMSVRFKPPYVPKRDAVHNFHLDSGLRQALKVPITGVRPPAPVVVDLKERLLVSGHTTA
ncbi:hypothetical protein Efla_002439 [Eimeria flavescens]